jgi:hypothetical protein
MHFESLTDAQILEEVMGRLRQVQPPFPLAG